MLYPSIQQITKGKINRYTLVIATAKSARHVTEKANEDASQGELKYEKVSLEESNEKAVSVAIDKIYHGKYNIIPAEVDE